jgi:hypothetical protein
MSNALPENTDARRAEFIPDPMDPKQMVRPGYMPFMPSAEDRMRLLIQPGSDVSQGMDGFPVVGADSGSTASESRTSANP